MKRLIKFALAGAVGAYVAEAYILPAMKIESGSGFGVDDVVVGATVAVTLIAVDRLF